ncbi:succinate dehydrogenase assembly factor 2 [Methyloligella sp. 2.7D]|uniref:FAD assembly factor SdhE n=1 Tax=unclassified Methyloligella TaxID=2625955 RepID=UPI00157C67C1|nr:succinate dehydrogenase assembly factor 2 [Methyloligella sp. GL2]QKP77664.1 succinate dehydrogenase assembly factor 2 [Methyloligella sp. GL2]
MSETLELRRRRALYRATHRGSKEMDFLLGRYAGEAIGAMDDGDLTVLERLIDAPDPLLAECIYEGTRLGDAELDSLLGEIRRFHGFPAEPPQELTKN